MSLVLNTNINSLMAQQNLSSSQMTLSTAMQRLSSGLRINSAADDAAGYAIAQRMTTQVNGLGQAQRNANDGISLAQVAEGALSELTNNLQSIRELAVQSANATNSASDRAALDTEVQQRLAEINRTATQTTFNGQHVLDGTLGSATFQVGANVGETIGISLTSNMKLNAIGSLATTNTTGSIASLFSNGAGLTLAAGDLTVNTGAGAVNVAAGTYTSAQSLVDAINSAAAGIASVSGSEIKITNTSLTNAITFGGSAAATVGLGTVAHATAGAAATNAYYQSGAVSSFDYSVATATSGSYTSPNITLADYSTTNSVFTVDSHTVTLNTDYTTGGKTLTDVANDIQTQLDAASSGTYQTTVSGSGIQIAKTATGSSSTAPVIADVSGATTWSGGSSVAGQDVTNKHFTVDGHAVNLTTDDTNLAGLVNDIQTQLDAASSGTYTVSSSAGGVKIALTTAGAASAPVIAGADASFITTGGSSANGTAAGATIDTTATSTGVDSAVTKPGTLTLAAGDFTLKVGTGTTIDLAGTYTSSQDLADAINSKVPGMYASIESNGQLDLSAADTITVGGAKAGAGAANLNFGTVGSAIATSGDLSSANVLTVDAANNLMQRVDSALTAVSNFNSVLGAIQNRFQSAINSDAAATQNVTSARSRIQDADFAAETSKMTSANILQQAGVSVLAQANSQQQFILKLLQ
ncbi:MAG TPA: flagellin [Steroidobacteraceae bacterium]|nr:flagellin [Steroidobacteraceae bacterium]